MRTRRSTWSAPRTAVVRGRRRPDSTLLSPGARAGPTDAVHRRSATTPTGSGTTWWSTGQAWSSVAFGATYGPALVPRAARLPCGRRCAGDHAPLLRLVAEADSSPADAGDPVDYSEGLDAAVSCHDYPQLYDMTAPPAQRGSSSRPRVQARSATDPGRLRAVHGAGVPRLGLGGAGLVPALAGRLGGAPGRPAGAAGRALPGRPDAGADRRARLDHDARRGRAGARPVPRRRAGAHREQLPRDRRRRQRPLRRGRPAGVRPGPAARRHARCAGVHEPGPAGPRAAGLPALVHVGRPRVGPGRERRRHRRPSRRRDRGADHRRRAGPLVEQLRRQRRRPVRRALALHRRRPVHVHAEARYGSRRTSRSRAR